MRSSLLAASLLVTSLLNVSGTALAEGAEPQKGKVFEEDILAPAGTSRATLPPDVLAENLSAGGLIVSIPAKEIKYAPLQHPDYEEFLSRGRFSHTRSIGLGYSGGGRGYSISRGGGQAIRSSSSGISAGGSGGFATINNGPTSLGRSGSGGFATISNGGGLRR